MSDQTTGLPGDGHPEGESPSGTVPTDRRRSRGILAPVASALAVVLVAGGGFAAWRFLSDSGPQVAEVLPRSTFALATLDLDPSGSQKIEAIKALRKFPTFRRNLKVSDASDLMQKFVEEALSDSTCKNLSYTEDFKPWIGQSVAVGAVRLGDQKPAPVMALETTDAEKARSSFGAVADCVAKEDDSKFGWAMAGDFVIASDSTQHAQAIAAAGKESPLAGDASYLKWTEEAGTDGIAGFYVAKDAPEVVADLVDEQMSQGFSLDDDAANEDDQQAYLESLPADMPQAQREKLLEQFRDEVRVDPVSPDQLPHPGKQLREQFKDFTGAAGTVRFADNGIELAVAGGGVKSIAGAEPVGEQVAKLPADTLAALSFGVSPDAVEQLGSASGALDPLGIAEGLGLTLPRDLETLLGDSLTLAVGGDAPADLDAVESPAGLPIGVMVKGDPEDFRAVVAKVERATGAKLADVPATMKTSGDRVAIATNDGYADSLLGSGSLGRSAAFRDVVPEADKAVAVGFFQLDGAWRAALKKSAAAEGLGKDAAEAFGDLDAVRAAGLSAWTDGSTSHALVRISLR